MPTAETTLLPAYSATSKTSLTSSARLAAVGKASAFEGREDNESNFFMRLQRPTRREPTTNQARLLGDRFDVVLLRFGGMRRGKRGRFLGRLTWLVGLDLGHLLSNAAFSFQSVIGVLQPQEIAFGQTEKLA